MYFSNNLSDRQNALCLLIASVPYFIFSIVGLYLVPKGDLITYWIVDVIGYVAIPCAIFILALRKCSLTTQALGLVPILSLKEFVNLFWTSVVCTLLLLFTNILVVSFTRYLVHDSPALLELDYLSQGGLPKTWPERALVITYLVVTASIIEEIFFRGILKEVVFKLFQRNRVIIFVVFSTLVFSAAHWKLGFIPFVGALSTGILFGLLYVALADLRPLIIAHTVLNLYWFI